jgi:hypothetical protein
MASNPKLSLLLNCIPEAYLRRMGNIHQNLVFRILTLREFEEIDIGWHNSLQKKYLFYHSERCEESLFDLNPGKERFLGAQRASE